ncbi:hypothetical protein EHQ53_17135 [Leptospira langatensis]|uniref:WD40 repeat domain-containing protein n=1 Tax=Leptospira langatensis TaxID=2484983 RepID=A0A5F1ZNP9_9LEPT|nr:hypothetical protein [Leptospira langatensis]TGK05361.1 hypothetical protein EHO57_01375 [Leptospira langatensis]TGL38497.1 hypothetical protein EHQ53_17135 [Leptospira langatensis]
MIARILGLSLIFFFLFYFFLGNPYEAARTVQKTWSWNKEAKLGNFPDPRSDFDPERKLNGYKSKTDYIRIPGGESIPTDDSNRIEFPLTSKGYLVYKKIGNSVEFFSEAGELLWTKEYKSYPKIHPDGNIVLFLAGDNNQVLVSDINGNSVGAKKLDGRFLTDIAFSPNGISNGETAVLFSGGELFLLDGKGEKLFEAKMGEKEPVFAKSLTVSPDGTKIGVHFLKGNRDFIRVYDRKGSELEEWNLGRVLPHKTYMAISNEGELLSGFHDKLVLYSKTGKILFEKNRSKSQAVYQTVFHSGTWFAGEWESNLFFLDSKGNVLREEKVRTSEKPFRFFSNGRSGEAFFEGGKDIVLYRELERGQ